MNAEQAAKEPVWYILFLDVDGVLNHENMSWINDYLSVDPLCVQRVVDICDEIGARIVVSSTWRRNTTAMRVLRQLFGRRIIGVTPVGPLNCHRRAEIAMWVTDHSAIPIVAVAVDDDHDVDGIGWETVNTSAAEGLTAAKAVEILTLLKRGKESV